MGEVSYTLPPSRTIVPDSLITNLKFIDSSHNVMNNTGLTYSTVRFRPSSAFDIDPVLGSTAIPGFNELSSFYGKYRVLSSKITVHFSNLEKNPVNVYIWPTNFDLGANYVFLAASMAAPFSKKGVISARTGNDHKVLSKYMRTADIFGTDEVLYDDDYSAVITTNPNNNWYWNVGIWSPVAALESGVMTNIEIDIQVQFTERFTLTT
jgi:hypothetical protein